MDRTIQALYRPRNSAVVPKFREQGKSLKELMDKSHHWLDNGRAEFWDVSGNQPPHMIAYAFADGRHYAHGGKRLITQEDYDNV